MQLATVREFRNSVARYLNRPEPVLLTRHGKVKGIYLPIQEAQGLPLEIRRELLVQFGRYISGMLRKAGVREKDLLEDFRAFKKSRGRR